MRATKIILTVVIATMVLLPVLLITRSRHAQPRFEITPSGQTAAEVFEIQAGEPNTILLTTLANKYGTDKGTGFHAYSEVYEYFFHPLKNTADKIFEIGVLEGASLKMFRDYFPNATVYGIDILDTSHLDGDRLRTFIADQTDRQQLKTVMDAVGGDLDIIVDDGGHAMDHQQISFCFLFPYVKSGGYYIIEDVHTSVYALFKDTYGAQKNQENTTLTMIDTFIRSGKINSEYMTAQEEKYLGDNILYCSLVSRQKGKSITCIFKKK